jgi:hypothetical protein
VLILNGPIGGLFNLAFFFVLLLVPAGLVAGGTWHWPRAFVFLGMNGVLVESSIVVLAEMEPASLEARLRRPVSKKQPVTDSLSFHLIQEAQVTSF